MLASTSRKAVLKREGCFTLFHTRNSEENSDPDPQALKRDYWWTKIKHRKIKREKLYNSVKIITLFIKKMLGHSGCISSYDEQCLIYGFNRVTSYHLTISHTELIKNEP